MPTTLSSLLAQFRWFSPFERQCLSAVVKLIPTFGQQTPVGGGGFGGHSRGGIMISQYAANGSKTIRWLAFKCGYTRS
jgi:hypothetical protein